ncbi:MAG: CRTAC1 family protein, partial [Gemmataceae bacterium]|nr:CRTAC1 family protein [Gemmataceae bacterium]
MYVVALPRLLQALPDSLYRNCGDGLFADASAMSGIASVPPQCGLGVVAADLDGDGDADLYVSNDMGPNFLWENQGHGTFVDRGLEAGAAMNRNGACEAGMSLEAADFDGDGRCDLFVTNFFHETNTFYRNEGNLLFSDVTHEVGLGAPSKLRLGFGTCAVDFDRDGFLDLFVANGHVHDRLHEIGRDEPFAQLPLLFHNERGLRFGEVSAATGGYFAQPHVGRGAAAADFDRDGDVDVAISHLNGPAALLRNDATPAGGWLQIELIGRISNRSGVGALVTVDLAGNRLVRTRQAGSGYCSCGEERLTIGLGDATRVPRVSV